MDVCRRQSSSVGSVSVVIRGGSRCVLCVDRRLLDAYDSARVSQYEYYLEARLGRRHELTVPALAVPVLLTTAAQHCAVPAAAAAAAGRPRTAAHQQQQQQDEPDEDRDDDDDDDGD